MMDKYGVATDEETVREQRERERTQKTASARACPACGNMNVDYSGAVPHCPNCGTRPWERRRG